MNSFDYFYENPIIDVSNLSKIYSSGEAKIIALEKASLKIEKGSFVVIVGPSGSGKSTLLHLLAGLDHPTLNEGKKQIGIEHPKLEVIGDSLLNRNENWLSKFRAEHIGFVLQFFGLLPTLTVLENVMMAGYFNKKNAKERLEQSKRILDQVGLSDRLDFYPNQLSGGQKQRVAIARALVNEPEIIFADEPTGNLDSKTGEDILKLLIKISEDRSRTVIIVTHDLEVAKYCDQIIEIFDGRIVRNEMITDLPKKNKNKIDKIGVI